MAHDRGFFSVARFCPDMERGECVNVGVVLVVPSLGFLDVRMSEDNEAPKQRFGASSYDDIRLSLAKHGLVSRIREEAKNLTSIDKFQRFANKEGNNLTLSEPKVILVEDAASEIGDLFMRLVHVEAQRRRRQPKPDLRDRFETKLMGIPLERNLSVEIPQYGTLDVPYAYRNGVLNLVRPEGFPLDEASASNKANELAVKGHLIARQPGDSRRLIVVGGFDASATEELKGRVSFVLREHDTRLVREDQLDEFVDEIRRVAH